MLGIQTLETSKNNNELLSPMASTENINPEESPEPEEWTDYYEEDVNDDLGGEEDINNLLNDYSQILE